MNKIITQENIQSIMNIIYQTNISARDFDAIKLFLAQLPTAPVAESVPEGQK